MSYPQQQWQAYMAQAYPEPVVRRGSPVLAIMSAIVGLGIAGTMVWQTVELLDLADGVELPGGWLAMVIAHFVVAGVAAIGAVLVFSRLVAGAVVLMICAVLTIGVLLAAPFVAEGVAGTMVSSIPGYATSAEELYFHELFEFEFDNSQATLRFAALALGVILLITAMLPPSLKWLRRSRQNDYSAQQAGW
jgi:hypothetical protein